MINEERLKDMAAQEANCAAGIGTIGGYANQAMGLDTDAPSLRSRIHSQLRCAQRESRKANLLSELEYLLDKNPETARILELMEQVGK